MSTIIRAWAGTHASKFIQAIYCIQNQSLFLLFVLLLCTSSNETFFIEEFLIEDYIQET